MTRVAIILAEDGAFETVLGDSEIDVVVLKRGVDDRAIDTAEHELSEAEWANERD